MSLHLGLFEPFRSVSGLELKNRVVMAPMPTFAAEPDGRVSDAEVRYYRRRAEGGVAAVVTAGCAVAEDALAFPGQWRCDHDRFLPSLQRVGEAIQAAGAKAVLQIAHAGGDGPGVVQAFARAAARARAARFDAVEIHGGHNELLQQALGAGSDLPVEVVGAVREAGPASVWYRVDPGADPGEPSPGAHVERLLAECAFDLLDLSGKRYARPEWRRRPAPAWIAVGGIETPAGAEQALEDGASLVGLGHVLLADPDWTARVRDGVWAPLDGPPAASALREALTPAPVIDYLVKKGRALAS